MKYYTIFITTMPRARGRTQIVPQQEVLNIQRRLGEHWTLVTLHEATSTNARCLEWLARRCLLKDEMICNICNINFSFIVFAEGIDRMRWKCPTCNKRKSVRDGSFFEKSKLPLHKLLKIAYLWSLATSQQTVGREVEVDTGHTTVDWYNFFRDLCLGAVINRRERVGGYDDVNGELVPKIVEIDESKFFRPKYNRGRHRDGHWVFGGIERGTKKCFLVEVAQRDANTLLPTIEDWIEPGTQIISDGWAAYNRVDQIQGGIYTHEVIIHEQNFVDPNDPSIHTQNVENMWSRAKRVFKRQYGTSRELFESYLIEFMWRNIIENDPFAEILVEISRQYNV